MVKNLKVRGKRCETCDIRVVTDEIYCAKCWKVVNAIMLEPERFLLVLSKLRNCNLCSFDAEICTNWSQG